MAGILSETIKGSPKKNQLISPTERMLTAFQKLKQALLEAPILTYPQFYTDEPFILDNDWSKENNCTYWSRFIPSPKWIGKGYPLRGQEAEHSTVQLFLQQRGNLRCHPFHATVAILPYPEEVHPPDRSPGPEMD